MVPMTICRLSVKICDKFSLIGSKETGVLYREFVSTRQINIETVQSLQELIKLTLTM